MTSRNSELRQAYNALRGPTTALEICNLIIACQHYQDGEEGEPPQLHRLSDLAPHDPVQVAHDTATVDWEDIKRLPFRHLRDALGFEGPAYEVPELVEAADRAQAEIEEIDKTIAELNDDERAQFQHSVRLADWVGFFTGAVLVIDDFSRRIERIHIEWVEALRRVPNLQHPLAPIVRAWVVTEQIPKVEPERRKDTGILQHPLRNSAPSPRLNSEVIEELPPGIEQMSIFSNLPQGDLQMELPGFVFPESEIVPALPLVAYEKAGGRPKQSGPGAPIEQRLFANVLIEYEQRQRSMFNTARLNTTYRDVKSWLYPNGTKEPRKTLIPKLYRGMWYLHNLRFVWERREWNIVSVDSLPTMEIKLDDALTFTVRMPDGMNTKHGPLIGIEALRLYGAQAAPKFRAWVRLAYLWDAAKIRNGGKRIYATIPEVLRNSDGYLVDARGEVILTGDLYHTEGGWKFRNGSQPQKAWYHPLAIQTGEQVRNPQADKVPILSDSDMVKLFYDHTERNGKVFRDCLRLARSHAEGMQDDGRIVVEADRTNEKTGTKGWRILEPHQHAEV